MSRSDLPSGTVTFMFTDIEDSTGHVRRLGERWASVLERHFEILDSAVTSHDGIVVKSEGDSLFSVFVDSTDAVLAAAQAQRELFDEEWVDGSKLMVRIGIHTGLGTLGGPDYVGLDVHRASRIADAGHGGQVLVSEPASALAERRLPHSISLHDLGKFRLKSLDDSETLFQAEIDELPHDFPPLRTLDAIPNNLPEQLTTFIGRKNEIEKAVALLSRSRILTLTGPGGTGKTRLALQIAATISDQFEDGVFFVGLSTITDVEVVPSEILSSVGAPPPGGDLSPEEYLNLSLRGKRLLIVLDNFEQLLAGAGMIADLVKASLGSRFIITSRAPLRIGGEQELPIAPLPVPNKTDLTGALEFDSVHLFVDRAMATRPDFVLSEGNILRVVDLVRRLDGLPLAIELITSRLRHFPLETILNRLDSSMLATGSVDLPKRQRSIESVIAWSYDLLEKPQRILFARLSVFVGGARIDEIERLCNEWDLGISLLDGLSELVDHSLVLPSVTDGGHRYRMLHVIREFALTRLEESGDAQSAHSGHLRTYTELVESAAPHLLGPQRVQWLDVLEADHDNVRAALDWGMANNQVDLVFRLGSAMWRFWQARGHLHEAERRLRAAVELSAGDRHLRAKTIEALGGVLWWRGDVESSESFYDEALEMQRDLGNPLEIANALYNYGLTRCFSKRSRDAGWRFLDEAYSIYMEMGDHDGLGNVLWGMGTVHTLVEDYEVAIEYFESAADAYRKAENSFGLSWALFELAGINQRSNKQMDAWRWLTEALALFEHSKDISGVVLGAGVASAISKDLGDLERAYRLAGAVQSLVETSGAGIVGLEINLTEGLDPETLDKLTGSDLAAFQSGKTMSYTEIVSYAASGPTDAVAD